MMKSIASLLLLAVLAVPLCAQTATDLAGHFTHNTFYEIEPGIIMRAKFDTAGMVCEMTVEPSHFKGDTISYADGIEEAKTKAILDRLVPAAERGAKIEDESIEAVGGLAQRTEEYANVTVLRYSRVEMDKNHDMRFSETVLQVRWKNRTCA